ncbi:MAG TPA: imelysin family protein, partial [Labilithrix sp.]|nr:imelysin family protein [Labilithrix sp.]
MRSEIIALGLAAAAVVTAAVACSTTDPRAGIGTKKTTPSSPSSSGGSSSGGIDAAAPEGPLDCGPAPGKDAPFSKAALLHAAAECATWHACSFQNAATALRTSYHELAESPSEAKLAIARSAWKAAMNEWSKMELFQFGPGGSKVVDKYHGRGLRTFVHPWPDLNRCQVETQIVTKTYQQGWDVVLPSGRGLHALEYALFYSGTDTLCLPNSTAAKTWATLSPEQITASKTEYALAVADNVAAIALELRNVWLPAPEGENFGAKLASFEGYGSEQETLNVVAWSLYYPEKE